MLEIVTTRHRTRVTHHKLTYLNWKVFQGGTIVPGSAQVNYEQDTESISDVPHSKFAQRVRSGEVILGDLLLSRTSRRISPGYIRQGPWTHATAVGPPGSWTEYSGDLSSRFECYIPASDAQIDVQQLRNLSLVKAYAKVNEATVLSGEFINSFDDTVRMLRRPFSNSVKLLGRMTKYVKLKKGKTAASLARAKANAWLEYRYGWLPLLLDAESIQKEVHKGWTLKRQRLVARAGVKDAHERTIFVPQWNDPDYVFTYEGNVGCNVAVDANSGVIYEIVNRRAVSELQRMLGLRASDIPATLWETVPLSFVVDWFVQVGPWLSAITPQPDVNIIGTWTTTVEKTFSYIGDGKLGRTLNWPPVMTVHGTSGMLSITTEIITRKCNMPLPFAPVLTVGKLSIPRSLDAVSLLAGAILNGLRSFVK